MVFHLIVILILHFVADFLLQTRTMAINKGKSIMWLSMHVGIYLIALLTFGLLLGHHILDDDSNMMPILEYCFLNAIMHWITDFFTSKLSGVCYLKMVKYKKECNIKKEYLWQYYFWSIIGLDFTSHALTLIYTYFLFFV